jgi:arsenite methyltransferase
MTPWLASLLQIDPPDEGTRVAFGDAYFVVRDGILRSERTSSSRQRQTEHTFGFKWTRHDSFEGDAWQMNLRQWLAEKYGNIEQYLPDDNFLLCDAGCGASVSALQLFEPVLGRLRYLGVDVSDAVDVAHERCKSRGVDADFLQCDLNALPLPPGSVDVIFSEGVLHHTDSTERALKALVPLLRPRGLILFYVYRKKGPIREFSDDYIRAKLAGSTPQEAWDAIMPLTRLGKALGELDAEVNVPEDIDILGIPAGRINVQRLFYWHVCKAFYRVDFTLEEMNHINFDWFAPANAHRQSPDDVRRWCVEAGLIIERELVEDAGITVVARKAIAPCAA